MSSQAPVVVLAAGSHHAEAHVALAAVRRRHRPPAPAAPADPRAIGQPDERPAAEGLADMTQGEIGELLGASQVQISQIMRQPLHQLRHVADQQQRIIEQRRGGLLG